MMSNTAFWVLTGFLVYLGVLAIFEKDGNDNDF